MALERSIHPASLNAEDQEKLSPKALRLAPLPGLSFPLMGKDTRSFSYVISTGSDHDDSLSITSDTCEGLPFESWQLGELQRRGKRHTGLAHAVPARSSIRQSRDRCRSDPVYQSPFRLFLADRERIWVPVFSDLRDTKAPICGVLGEVADRIRTGDRLDHNQELYQLSYSHHVLSI